MGGAQEPSGSPAHAHAAALLHERAGGLRGVTEASWTSGSSAAHVYSHHLGTRLKEPPLRRRRSRANMLRRASALVLLCSRPAALSTRLWWGAGCVAVLCSSL